MRSPTWRRRPPQPHPLPLAVPPRPQPPPSCRCNPTLSSNPRRICSPCILRLLIQCRQRRSRCSARHWLPLRKISPLRLLHRFLLLAPLHPLALRRRLLFPLSLRRLQSPFPLLARLRLRLLHRRLPFLLPLRLLLPCPLLARLRLRLLQRRLLFLLPLRLLLPCPLLARLRLRLLQRRLPFLLPLRLLQRRLLFLLPLRLLLLCPPSARLRLPARLRRLAFLLLLQRSNLQRLRFHRRSFPPHNNPRQPLPRHRCNLSVERSRGSELRSSLLSARPLRSRLQLSQGRPNLSILLLRHPRERWHPEHLRSPASAAPSCSGSFPRSSSSPPQLSLPRPRASLRHRPLLHSSHLLPSLPPWRRSLLSPRLFPLSHLPHAGCSTPRLPANHCLPSQHRPRPDPRRSMRPHRRLFRLLSPPRQHPPRPHPLLLKWRR
jgi:hypothetical protein